MTLAILRGQVLKRFDDDSIPFSFTIPEVNAAINKGQALFALISLCLERQTTLDITIGAYFVQMLDFFEDWICPLRITSAAGAKVRYATLQELDAFDSAWKLDHSPAKRYGTQGTLFFLYGSAVQTLTFTYAQSAPKLVADSDVPAIPERHHPVLSDYAMYHLSKRLGGQVLANAQATNWKRFLEAAQTESAIILARRTKALGYDTAPFEITRAIMAALAMEKPARKDKAA